jgi:AcrR family transcriptional regulator
MSKKSAEGRAYHHGNLAESLLNAVEELATRFGLEAVTLRGCARRVGVAPSSAFRHYADKRALLTAFATRALRRISKAMDAARVRTAREGGHAFRAVGLAYVEFALDRPALFRAMWHEEAIYSNEPDYVAAADRLRVHGLASLFVDGPVAKGESKDQKMTRAAEMLEAMGPALS